MSVWFFIFGSLYLLSLAYISIRSKSEHTDDTSFVLGGKGLSTLMGVLTYSATLFSTFTLMGLPNFFRTHGVGAWIFLGITDVAMAFVALLFGLKLKKEFKNKNYLNMSSYLKDIYKHPIAVWTFLAGIFIFLIPYTAIQIRGIALFFEQAIPLGIPMWVWALLILVVIMIYSSIGGFKAIVYSDAIQGVILLLVAWVVAIFCLTKVGGFDELFIQVNQKKPELLSVPGPKGLFSFQFLVSSFLAIIVMPITQPQLTTRLMAMKDLKNLRTMAPSVAIFAILVIFPAMLMGLYGSLFYADVPATHFWSGLLINEQPGILSGLATIGLLAAAMSTADSQLFALGNETRTLMKNKDGLLLKTKLVILTFSIASLLFAIFTKGELVPLARLSFAGTAILAPMIAAPIFFSKKSMGPTLPILTLISLIIFICANFFNLIPKTLGSLRIDLIIFIVLPITAIIISLSNKDSKS